MAAAQRLGDVLAARGWLPEAALCSAARRVLQTWETIAPSLTLAAAPQVMRSLYLAPRSRLFETLRRQPGSRASVLLITHNPGIHNLALSLAGPASDTSAVARLHTGYPPAALSVFDVAIDTWAALAPGAGRLSHVLWPNDPA